MDYHIKNISYKYSEKGPMILNNVDFNIRSGEVTAVVGPSGCGKSTLVNILSGVIPELITNGKLEGDLEIFKNLLVSVVSQSPEDQLFGYGVEDAIAFGIENMGIDHEEIVKRVEYVLDLLNLQHLRGRSIANLSGGQRQAVCIASVLAIYPDILIMDEPVSSLDPNGKKLIQNVLRQMRSSGSTTVIVDNNLEWSSEIVDHVIGLVEGKVIFDGTKEEFFNDSGIQEILGVTITQEAEIYREISKHFPQLNMFYTEEGAKKQLSEIVKPSAYKTNAACEENTSSPLLTTHQLCKTFNDGFHALIDINTSFHKGKIIAILGQNGSGKTTLVKHLNGLYKPTCGDVRYMGESTLKRTVAQISKNIILVFQNPEHMLFEETVMKEITFCARMQKIPYTDEQVINVLNEYGFKNDAETFPQNLSMGKKHILTILSVLFSGADVVIFDEPTLGMDLHLKNQLEKIILNIKEAGKTVIIISHEIPFIFKIIDSAVILSNGTKIFEGTKDELVERDDVFKDINISLPPVIRLSKYFGFKNVCYDVSSFTDEIIRSAKH